MAMRLGIVMKTEYEATLSLLFSPTRQNSRSGWRILCLIRGLAVMLGSYGREVLRNRMEFFSVLLLCPGRYLGSIYTRQLVTGSSRALKYPNI